MLAISSDLDGTKSAQEYFELLRFWNSGEQTQLGRGLSLQFANSLYFSMPERQFSYWNASVSDREMIRDLIREGLIDSIHSFGNLAVTEREVRRTLDEFDRYQLHMPIWSNHETVPSNFKSPRKTSALGDSRGADIYHADRTIKSGLRYVCLGQVTSIIGQETRPNPFRGAGRSFGTVTRSAKQLGKLALASVDPRFSAHRRNHVLNEVKLMDRNRVFEVLRANWHAKGIRLGCHAQYFHELIDATNLSLLAKSGGAAVIYTHLGGLFRLEPRQRAIAINGLRNLPDTLEAFGVLVRTTGDLLDYLNLSSGIALSVDDNQLSPKVDISTKAVQLTPEQSIAALYRSGLTLEIESLTQPEITVDGQRPITAINIERIRDGEWRAQFPLKFRSMAI